MTWARTSSRTSVSPQRLWQLCIAGLHNDFPALQTLTDRPTNLPAQPAPFVGRRQEVAALRAWLGTGEDRLITLTGPGGGGKTRLALQVAAELVDTFPDGVMFVDLAPLVGLGLRLLGRRTSTPPVAVPLGFRLLLWLVGHVLRSSLQGRFECFSAALVNAQDYLRDRRLLLVQGEADVDATSAGSCRRSAPPVTVALDIVGAIVIRLRRRRRVGTVRLGLRLLRRTEFVGYGALRIRHPHHEPPAVAGFPGRRT